MLDEAEDRRTLVLGVVAADSLKKARTVMDGVGQHVDFRVGEIDELPIHPDLFDFLERHWGDLLVRLHAARWLLRAGA